MITIFEAILLGVIQGIAEWLPISSEAMVNIIAINIFDINPESSLQLALLLHLGTVAAAIIYFRKKIWALLVNVKDHRTEWYFYIIANIISVLLGGILYLGLEQVTQAESGGAWLTLLMGLSLIVTAWLLRRNKTGLKTTSETNWLDGIILGITQGLAIIPGISRSGSTSTILLLRNFKARSALELSFLMGIPMIVIGSIVLTVKDSAVVLPLLFSAAGIVALMTTFVTGLLTIKLLLSFAKKVNFSKFVLMLGTLTIIAGFLSL